MKPGQKHSHYGYTKIKLSTKRKGFSHANLNCLHVDFSYQFVLQREPRCWAIHHRLQDRDFRFKQQRCGRLGMTENGPREQAVHAVLNVMFIRKAARTLSDVKKEALRRQVHGLVDMHAKKGRRPVYLSRGHEQGVVEVVAACSHMGFPSRNPSCAI